MPKPPTAGSWPMALGMRNTPVLVIMAPLATPYPQASRRACRSLPARPGDWEWAPSHAPPAMAPNAAAPIPNSFQSEAAAASPRAPTRAPTPIHPARGITRHGAESEKVGMERRNGAGDSDGAASAFLRGRAGPATGAAGGTARPSAVSYGLSAGPKRQKPSIPKGGIEGRAVRTGLEPATSAVTGQHSKPTELPDRRVISASRYKNEIVSGSQREKCSHRFNP